MIEQPQWFTWSADATSTRSLDYKKSNTFQNLLPCIVFE